MPKDKRQGVPKGCRRVFVNLVSLLAFGLLKAHLCSKTREGQESHLCPRHIAKGFFFA